MSNSESNKDDHDQQVNDKKDLDPIGVSGPVIYDSIANKGVDGPEEFDATSGPSTFKRVLYWFRDVARGDNKTGQVLSDVKDVVLPIFPLGETINRVTDYVGKQLRGEGGIGKLLSTLKRKLKEPSTYQGLAVVAGVVGINIDQSAAYEIGSAVGAIFGTIQVIRQEKEKNKGENEDDDSA